MTRGMGATEVYVQVIPNCTFCFNNGLGTPASYDGKTDSGPWAFMCETHFKIYGTGLGTGKGQRLIKIE